MKYSLLLSILVLSACSSLSNYQEQAVTALGDNSFKTTCNGMAEAFDSCYRKATKACGDGYDLLEKNQLNDFVHREITFKCK